MHLIGGVCVAYCIFLDGPTSPMRRSADVLTSHYFILTSHLKFFGHTARANPSMDYSQALKATLAPLPRDWNLPSDRLRHTWLRMVEADLAPLNMQPPIVELRIDELGGRS